jgi:hypothetical protein
MENWGLFKLPSDQEGDPPRCEQCQLLTSTFVTGAEQLLQLGLWLDRWTRFGKSADASEISAKIHAQSQEVATAWGNYLKHRVQSH